MEKYKTVTGDEKVNKLIAQGWKVVHVFTKVVDYSEKGIPTQFDAAFVAHWSHPSEPPTQQQPSVE